MNEQYCYKLKKLVNNLNGKSVLSNRINKLKHNMSNNGYLVKSEAFYSENKKLMISLAEDNINTITDFNNYLNWMVYDK